MSYPPCPGRIRTTDATQSLFVQVDELRAAKRQHDWLSLEWLRLGGKVCELSEAIRKIETEGHR